MSDLHISWERYERDIEQLAKKVWNDYKFNQIVCIAKGGLRVGDIFARLFDVPLAIMAAESYHGEKVKNSQGALIFSNSLAKTTPNLGNKVILVDDLADSGKTLEKSMEYLRHYHGFFIEELKSGVLWVKGCSEYTPDYYVDLMPDNPWIHQPMEKYEAMRIEDIK